MLNQRPAVLTREELTKAAQGSVTIALEDRAIAFAADPSMALMPQDPMGIYLANP